MVAQTNLVLKPKGMKSLLIYRLTSSRRYPQAVPADGRRAGLCGGERGGRGAEEAPGADRHRQGPACGHEDHPGPELIAVITFLTPLTPGGSPLL